MIFIIEFRVAMEQNKEFEHEYGSIFLKWAVNILMIVSFYLR